MKTEKLTMKATLPADNVSNVRNYGGEKETVSTYVVVGKRGGELASIVEARFYMGRSRDSSTVYCALWVNGASYCSGKGTAGGYGYHKESAALQSAITSAGIVLHGSNYSTWGDKKPDFKKAAHIGGCGCDSMRTALKAIARAAGATGQLLIV
jgi:hypothetical protein